MDLAFFNNFDKENYSLIPLLQQIQENFGYLPKEALEQLSTYLGVPLSRVYGVATFYAQFNFTPLGKYLIKTCHGTACHVNGAISVATEIENELGIKENETSKDGFVTLQPVACLGCCSLAPCIMIKEKVYGKLTPDSARKIIKKLKKGEEE